MIPSVCSASEVPFLNHCILATRLTPGDSATQDIVIVSPTLTVWEAGGVSTPIAGEGGWVRGENLLLSTHNLQA